MAVRAVAARDPDPGMVVSAVLIPLYEIEGRTHLILTRRSPALRQHAHEMAFPGGRSDADDADAWATALRESHEEIGLDRDSVRRLGLLQPFVTVGSNTLVHPFVGAVPGRPELRAAPAEVESIRHVPVDELLRADVWREEIWPRWGHERPITFFELEGDTVWGATGAMLRQFLSLVTGAHDEPRR